MGREDSVWLCGFINKREEDTCSFGPEGSFCTFRSQVGKMHVNARTQDTGIAPRGSVAQHTLFFEQQRLCSPLTRTQCSAETSYATTDHNYINSLCWQCPDIRQFQFSVNDRVEVVPPGYLHNHHAPNNSARLSRKNWAIRAGSSFCKAICFRSASTTLHCSLAGR